MSKGSSGAYSYVLHISISWACKFTRNVHYLLTHGEMVSFSLDGHHKLIRWKLVTHAGIDGFTRLIVYLQCSSNNSAQTVYRAFMSAIHQYGLPSRVRSDQGTENTAVARHMLEIRGTERGSMIVGSSVHNQRIERMWKDMHR